MKPDGVYCMDAVKGVNMIPAGSVQCCVTSPPYFRQRDYGVEGQWGQESKPEEYVDRMVMLFRAIRWVLTDMGTAWIVIGDSYAGDRRGGQSGRMDYGQTYGSGVGLHQGIKRKDLLGIPWMVAFALRADGWYLRQDIIWFKTNGMPESVKDRCTRAHEYIFMLSKSERYFYDHLAIATPLLGSTLQRLSKGVEKQKGSNRVYGKKNDPMKTVFTTARNSADGHRHGVAKIANRKSVWPMATALSKVAHFASFPATIPDLCIRASSRPGDVVLDPFVGTGTTLLQASKLGRRYIGFDLNPAYVEISKRRLKEWEGIFFQE